MDSVSDPDLHPYPLTATRQVWVKDGSLKIYPPAEESSNDPVSSCASSEVFSFDSEGTCELSNSLDAEPKGAQQELEEKLKASEVKYVKLLGRCDGYYIEKKEKEEELKELESKLARMKNTLEDAKRDSDKKLKKSNIECNRLLEENSKLKRELIIAKREAEKRQDQSELQKMKDIIQRQEEELTALRQDKDMERLERQKVDKQKRVISRLEETGEYHHHTYQALLKENKQLIKEKKEAKRPKLSDFFTS